MKDLIKEKQKKKRAKALKQRKEVQKWFDNFRDELLEWTHIKK